MMSAGIGLNIWNAEMQDALSCASQSYATASQVSTMDLGLSKLKLAWDLRGLSAKLSGFLDLLYKGMKDAECGKTPAPAIPPTQEDIEYAIRSLQYMFEITDRLYRTAAQKQLTNNPLMARSLRSVHQRAEELLDLADWLHTSLTSKASDLDDLYSEARVDLAKGEVFTLA